MKVLSVLLCFALVHGITANLFRHHKHHRSGPEYEQEVDITIQHQSQNGDHQSGQHGQQPQVQHTQNQHSEQEEPQEEQHRGYKFRQNQASSAQQSQEQDTSYTTWQQSYKQQQEQQKTFQYSNENSQGSGEVQRQRNDYNDVQSTPRSGNQQWEPQAASKEQQKTTASFWPGVIAENPNTAVENNKVATNIFTDAKNAMRHIIEEHKAKLRHIFDHSSQEQDSVVLNVTQLARKHQYYAEEHKVEAADGYIHTVFRIQNKRLTHGLHKPVVFLMHGIDGSADDWLLMGPQKSLPYILADAGYDVWLGNARGNKYSRAHYTKHPSMKSFWTFSLKEMAEYDLAADIDYVLKTTAQKKMSYIGHSLGTAMGYMLVAARPKYNDKIVEMFSLSPMVEMRNTRSPVLHEIKRQQQLLEDGPFNPSSKMLDLFGASWFRELTGSKQLASNINMLISGFNYNETDTGIIKLVLQHLPGGTSNKLMRHVAQMMSNGLREYDYGPEINEKLYGTEEAPKYDVRNVQVPVTLFYSEDDWLVHPKDVERLEQELPNVKASYKVGGKHFSSLDFLFSEKARDEIYEPIMKSLKNYQ